MTKVSWFHPFLQIQKTLKTAASTVPLLNDAKSLICHARLSERAITTCAARSAYHVAITHDHDVFRCARIDRLPQPTDQLDRHVATHDNAFQLHTSVPWFPPPKNLHPLHWLQDSFCIQAEPSFRNAAFKMWHREWVKCIFPQGTDCIMKAICRMLTVKQLYHHNVYRGVFTSTVTNLLWFSICSKKLNAASQTKSTQTFYLNRSTNTTKGMEKYFSTSSQT